MIEHNQVYREIRGRHFQAASLLREGKKREEMGKRAKSFVEQKLTDLQSKSAFQVVAIQNSLLIHLLFTTNDQFGASACFQFDVRLRVPLFLGRTKEAQETEDEDEEEAIALVNSNRTIRKSSFQSEECEKETNRVCAT